LKEREEGKGKKEEGKMQNQSIQRGDLHARIFRWVIACLKLLKSLSRDTVSIVIIQQLAKACTSVGANDQEAVNSSSNKDFIAKYQISRKELAESIYWMKILHELYPLVDFSFCLKEAEELLRIISKIVLNVKQKQAI